MTKEQFIDHYTVTFFSAWSVGELRRKLKNPDYVVVVPPKDDQIEIMAAAIWDKYKAN